MMPKATQTRWDVRNVTTIVGLRPYAAQSNILPEQTPGRGLRRMYFGTDAQETVSVMGTPAFMDFVESIQNEGVSFERVPMGVGAKRQESIIVEVDKQGVVTRDVLTKHWTDWVDYWAVDFDYETRRPLTLRSAITERPATLASPENLTGLQPLRTDLPAMTMQ